MSVVISLYDFTGEALKPWAKAGYTCIALDLQHKTNYVKDGIEYRQFDANDVHDINNLLEEFEGKVSFLSAFPPCTDLAVSGARHFAAKKLADPLYREKALKLVKVSMYLGYRFNCPYYVENPVSVISTEIRKPDYIFHPYEYGGYIPGFDAKHPTWPEYIAPSDAYTKKTCLWVGNGFNMPKRKPVQLPVDYKYSAQHRLLGGKSLKTKNIRSATPRGFANAVYQANR
jgi:hypothetical protein